MRGVGLFGPLPARSALSHSEGGIGRFAHRLILISRSNDRVPCPGFFSGHGTPMLSDQALKQGRQGDALACAGDEGRSKLR